MLISTNNRQNALFRVSPKRRLLYMLGQVEINDSTKKQGGPCPQLNLMRAILIGPIAVVDVGKVDSSIAPLLTKWWCELCFWNLVPRDRAQ